MQGPRFRQQKVTIALSQVSFEQLEKLAAQKGILVPDYIRKMIIQHLVELGLPIYYDVGAEYNEEDKEEVDKAEETDAGQDA